MTKKELMFIAGARPNFMKIAPLIEACRPYSELRPFLVHTGQHYDPVMSKAIFEDLGIPKPDANLEVGSGGHGVQTGLVMQRLEPLVLERRPDMILVVGDVNSTIAATLVGVKLGIPVAHVEAGLRSGDRGMPEEINRMATDSISDLLFTHCKEANENLLREGVSKKRIHFVGNVMIDTLLRMLPKAKKERPLSTEPYGLVTLHRPSNVDEPEKLRGFLKALETIAEDTPLFFPVHPRTQSQMAKIGGLGKESRLQLIDPLSYLPFLKAMSEAEFVLTDSGGVQEETTALGVRCFTLRKNSERMITVEKGTNTIIGDDTSKIVSRVKRGLKTPISKKRPPKWDGKASQRIIEIVRTFPF